MDQKFINTYVDILVIENIYGAGNHSTMIRRQKILRDSGYTREKFLKKANSILEDKDMWVPFQKAVIARLDTLIEESNRNKEQRHRKRGED